LAWKKIEAIMIHCAQGRSENKLLLATLVVLAVTGFVTIGLSSTAQGQAQSPPTSAAHADTKFVLGDLKVEGDVHDRDGVRDRILTAWKDREYADTDQLVQDVLEMGVRVDFQDRGYFRVLITDPISQPLNLSGGKQSVLIITSITEGQQYRLGNLTFENIDAGHNLTIPAATLREQFHIRNQDLFNITEIRSGMGKRMLSYRDKGYREANVEPVIWIDDNHRIVETKFRVTEGPHTT
jgi:Surface antigen variable number repeat